jgi:hypothetical protein
LDRHKVSRGTDDITYVSSYGLTPQALQPSREGEGSGKGGLARKLKPGERESFYAEALESLKNPEDEAHTKYITAMLVANQLLLPALCDLALNWDQALALAQGAVREAGMVDVMLARHLSQIAASMGESQYDAGSKRLMLILAAISNGTRILPCLMTLARPANPAMQSKAVLMIGRIKRSVKWVLGRLADSDPRVRANAVEALWGNDTEEVRRVLRLAAGDRHNRVAGNALVALYRAGDPWALRELLKMVEHESPEFRATAAWIMGEAGDPRFTRILGRLVGEPHPAIRTRAFSSLGRIRSATSQARIANESQIMARFGRHSVANSQRLNLDIRSKDGQELAGVLSTQLILSEDGQDVVNYTLLEEPVPESVAVTFVLPGKPGNEQAPFQKGALSALAVKRPPDLWSVTPYRATPPPSLDTSPAEEPVTIAWEDVRQRYTVDREALESSFGTLTQNAEHAELWSTVRSAVQIDKTLMNVRRHAIIYADSAVGRPEDFSSVTSAATASHTTVHAISLNVNPAVEALCLATQGTFEIIASEDELASAIEQICFGLQSRYKVSYQSTADTRELRIIVNTAAGWGETTLAVPPLSRRPAE